jgi:putative toxin-antitoxin system antitoxin component (TIGR02293 family)
MEIFPYIYRTKIGIMAVTIEKNKAHSVRRRFNHLDLGSPYRIVFSARKGIRAKVFYDLADEIKMPEKELAHIINLSSRTIRNYKNQNKFLDPVYSEHLLKLIVLFEKGERVFGNIDEFNYWLQKPFWNKKEAPLDWINTPGGVDLLMEELNKLAQGYPA